MLEAVPPEVIGLCRQLSRAGHEAFVVGGAVRDLLLGRPVHDYDIATSALPEQMLQLFPRAIPTGLKHGTVTILVHGEPVEVTTYRVDGPCSDGRHPDRVTFVRSLEEDLARRDFTINALALDPVTGALRDPFGGRTDLAARLVRAVGEPCRRFAEDHLRVLRAVRFATVLDFQLDPATWDAACQAAGCLATVSAERVRDELLKLLLTARPSRGLRLLLESGMLAVILPELLPLVGQEQNHHHVHDVWGHTLVAVDTVSSTLELRLAALLHDVGKPTTAQPHPAGGCRFHGHEEASAGIADGVLQRLKLSTRQRERIVHLIRHHMFIALLDGQPVTDAAIRRFLHRVGPETLPDLLELGRADLVGTGRAAAAVDGLLAAFRARVAALLAGPVVTKLADLAIDGQDVMKALGCPPGRHVGDLLRRLEARVVDEPELNRREDLLRLLAEFAPPGSLPGPARG
ncbi:MAG: HD domain-containing protein [Myxococcota bacterium]|nr:HD domain-containing protein [Myxococcota bacterium]